MGPIIGSCEQIRAGKYYHRFTSVNIQTCFESTM